MGSIVRVMNKPPKLAKVFSGSPIGFDGALIEVEADIKVGLPSLQIVGMGSKAIDEARQRVRSAITNSALTFPAQKVTINLAPAELPKDGTHLDLPIAISILVASGQLSHTNVVSGLFFGELSLNGDLRPVKGAVILTELAKHKGLKRVFLPWPNLSQARLVTGIEAIPVRNIIEIFQHLKGVRLIEAEPIVNGEHDTRSETSITETPTRTSDSPSRPTFDSIIGQEPAKRALVIAAAGRHNILLTGPPGTGKTLLAKSLLSIMPPLSSQEVVESTKIHSLYSGNDGQVQVEPPLRAPHHSITLAALIGGGAKSRPGDISLAHKGVLLLDELPEYNRPVLEALRQPLEDRQISLSRTYGRITYPADALVVATMNPCPCGYYGLSPEVVGEAKQCHCTNLQIGRYQQKISGPLLDRLDLRVTVSKNSNEQFFDSKALLEKQQSKVIKLVLMARKAQESRYNCRDFYNAYASIKQVESLFQVSQDAQKLLNSANQRLKLSSRSYLRILRVARTIADIDRSPGVGPPHIAEALQFR